VGQFISLVEAIKEQIGRSHGALFGVLDFDNTCIVNDVGEATLAYIFRNCLIGRTQLYGISIAAGLAVRSAV